MSKNRFFLVFAIVLLTMAYTGLFLRTISGKEVRETPNHLILDPDDPIAFIGHGAMLDLKGHEIEPTLEFLQKAQEY